MKRVWLLHSGINTGKTSFLENLSSELAARGFSVAGILCPKEFLRSGRRVYFVQSALGGERKKLLEVSSGEIKVAGGGFRFAEREIAKSADVIIVDEFGHLEKEGGGFAPALLRYSGGADFVVSVRNGLLAEAESFFYGISAAVLPRPLSVFASASEMADEMEARR